jgi:dolichol-phosphate mannosyltransferase
MNKIVAMVPTYNERTHIRELVADVLAQDPRTEVLVVDDDSPDGTWRIVEEMAGTNPRVHLLRRTRKRGRGWAGIDGFQRALALGADAIIEMDGDYSHHPREIPRLLAALESCDVVVGSRAMEGGGDHRSAACRTGVTRLAAAYIRWALGVRVSDPTSGYRVFRRAVLEGIGLDRMRSSGPSIVEEILHVCHRRGYRIGEIPIHFEERRSGESKLTFGKLVRTAWFVAGLRVSGR